MDESLELWKIQFFDTSQKSNSINFEYLKGFFREEEEGKIQFDPIRIPQLSSLLHSNLHKIFISIFSVHKTHIRPPSAFNIARRYVNLILIQN